MNASLNKFYLITILLTLIMILASGYAFSISGDPFATRNKKLDQQRTTDLQNIKYAIENYYTSTKQLPDKLSDLSKVSNNAYYIKKLNDPGTNKPYDYKKGNGNAYQLCAEFATDSSQDDQTKDNSSLGISANENLAYTDYTSASHFAHSSGYKCFPLQAPISYTDSYNSTYSTQDTQDAQKISDLATMKSYITSLINEASGSAKAALLCNNAKAPCFGSSQTDTTQVDGTGWVKVNFTSKYLSTIPKDPINDTIAHYVYCSDGKDWEIDAVLEGTTYKGYMSADGGDDSSKYEVGTSLTLIGTKNICNYTKGLTNSSL
jgi:hypothetical protein